MGEKEKLHFGVPAALSLYLRKMISSEVGDEILEETKQISIVLLCLESSNSHMRLEHNLSFPLLSCGVTINLCF